MFRRYASSKPFQWPTTPNPSPHQIFHLPRNASQQDIKQRYFDLVRIYHPDKVEHSIASEIAHARFQAITAAYASLRGVSSDSQDAPPSPTARNLYKRNRRLYTAPPFSDERWKDRIIVSGVLLVGCIYLAQPCIEAVRRRFALSSTARQCGAT
ncbi:hypothetical protein FB45DRAFT_893408 [Roridomyces roridus]|uniref:J domain-containing protein n=1 Tax=Roridomyces roridus TaxID=1738132 RepID=A0AAD7CFE2_9AGAR|nr:hypothetical protein FB45DRAFT_893408 [Roridomyces roridus]